MRVLRSCDRYSLATAVILVALTILALLTVRDYAISNDEAVQQHYGELIVAYYRSGLVLRDVFSFQNLYLYGGLFDLIAVSLGQLIPIDPYLLRHMLCAMIGIGGIAATAATARLLGGHRAGTIAAICLASCGPWYGAMFNHTKDIPFASAMIGATFFLIRIARKFPTPPIGDIVVFGLLTGAALGQRVLGLLLLAYAACAILLYVPWAIPPFQRLHFAIAAGLRLLPAIGLAYLVMIFAWPWAALSPLNPMRALLAFSEFHYAIRTMFAGRVYEMAETPRLYVPVYILIRVPLITLAGSALALLAFLPRQRSLPSRDATLVALSVFVPILCQVAFHGPAFTGMRHFLFVIPPLAALAGLGLDRLLEAAMAQSRGVSAAAASLVAGCFLWDTATLVRLHPYEYVYYNQSVGGLPGAFGRFDLDYWFNSMPEAIGELESYLRNTALLAATFPTQVYSVAVCGERSAFEQAVMLPQLRWDFKPEWNQSEFFIAPTHMSCDRDLDGKIIATVERLGVPIAYVKDRRALVARPADLESSTVSLAPRSPDRKAN